MQGQHLHWTFYKETQLKLRKNCSKIFLGPYEDLKESYEA